MVVFAHPRCVKFQKKHPGMHLITCYIHVLFHKPIKWVKRYILRSEREDDGSFEYGGDIGLGSILYSRRSVSNLELDGQNHPLPIRSGHHDIRELEGIADHSVDSG